LKEFIRVDTGLFVLLGQRCQSLQSDERGLDSVPIHLIRLLSVVDIRLVEIVQPLHLPASAVIRKLQE
jgi:hypothetical protein